MFISTKKPAYQATLAHQRGFTLTELLIVISIIAILATIAAPNLSHALERQRNKETAQSIVYALKEARTESFLRKQDVSVVLSADNIAVQVMGVAGQSEKLSSYPIHSNITVTASSGNTIIFQPNKRVKNASGTSIGQSGYAYSTTCNKYGKTGRTVAVDVNGNVAVKTENSQC